MKSKLYVCFIVVIAALLLVTPALAITYGELDGDAHPFVGSIVLEKDGEYFNYCSGTLISDNVFLTASHCTAGLDYYTTLGGYNYMGVTFHSTISASGPFYLGEWHTNPDYNGGQGQYGSSDTGDVAVIVLVAPPGIPQASLPVAGLLDELKAEHTLKDTIFTAVGYGAVRDTNRKAWQAFLPNKDRNRVDQEFLSLTGSWLTLSMNFATDNGGTCYGDSGGPHFIHIDGEETDIVASITVTGDAQCKATDKTYRMDTESARNFLSDFVDLP